MKAAILESLENFDVRDVPEPEIDSELRIDAN